MPDGVSLNGCCCLLSGFRLQPFSASAFPLLPTRVPDQPAAASALARATRNPWKHDIFTNRPLAGLQEWVEGVK
jgi:hypothetical protein